MAKIDAQSNEMCGMHSKGNSRGDGCRTTEVIPSKDDTVRLYTILQWTLEMLSVTIGHTKVTINRYTK